MSNTRKAFVEYIHVSEPRQGRGNKPYQTWNAKLQDPETGKIDEQWYQFGFAHPTSKAGREMQVGDYIMIEWEPHNDARRVVKDSLRIHPNPPERPGNPDEAAGGGTDAAHAKGKATPVKESEVFGQIGGYMTEDDVGRITRATALEAATRTVEMLLENKALKVSEAQGAAGVVKRYDQVITAIDKLATKYFYDLATGRQLEAHEDEGTVLGEQTETEELPDAEPTDPGEDFPEDDAPVGDEDFPPEGDPDDF